MPYIKKEFISRLLAQVDIVDVVGSRIKLKRSGSSYMACCPFHNEKTPSFSVNQQKQYFNCFGCHKAGSAVDFIMQYDNVSFPEAVEELAKIAGLSVEYDESASQHVDASKKEIDFYGIMEGAVSIYEKELQCHPDAINYLHNRGLSDDTLKKYHVGFAPDAWDFLLRKLGGNNPKIIKAMSELGLITEKQNGGFYDMFRKRVMIPIRDKRGRTIAFGGRVLDDSKPKYINSRENVIYRKGCELFNLDSIRNLRDHNLPYIMITEGYMDVIALEQAGIHNAVASLGTATTPIQMNLLFKQADKIIFCYDGDDAGRNAAWHALNTALPALTDNKQLCFCFLPPEHDPDTLVRTKGADAMRKLLEEAKPLPEYVVSHLLNEFKVDNEGGRVNCLDKVAEIISIMSNAPLTATSIKVLISTAIGWSFETVDNGIEKRLNAIQKKQIEGYQHHTEESSDKYNKTEKKDFWNPLRQIVAKILQNPEIVKSIPESERLEQVLNEFADERAQVILDLLNKISMYPDTNTGMLTEQYRGTKYEKIMNILASMETIQDNDFIEVKIIDLLTFIWLFLREGISARKLALQEKARNQTLSIKEMNEYKILSQKLLNIEELKQ